MRYLIDSDFELYAFTIRPNLTAEQFVEAIMSFIVKGIEMNFAWQ